MTWFRFVKDATTCRRFDCAETEPPYKLVPLALRFVRFPPSG